MEGGGIESERGSGEGGGMVEDLKRGRIKVVVNVEVLREGFEWGDVELVEMGGGRVRVGKYLEEGGGGVRK